MAEESFERDLELAFSNQLNFNCEYDDENYLEFVKYGLDSTVASKLDTLCKLGKLSLTDLDENMIREIKDFAVEDALTILSIYSEFNLDHVTHKSAYLFGLLQMYKQEYMGSGTASTDFVRNSGNIPSPVKPRYDSNIEAIIKRTGYSLVVNSGQRRYGGPPPDWDGPAPSSKCEVFCGKIPRSILEDELILIFEKYGIIWDLRLMMDRNTGYNRGYAFITYTTPEEALHAVECLNQYQIRPGKCLLVDISLTTKRLFVRNIPKSKSKKQIMKELRKYTGELIDVLIYPSYDDNMKNRGFAFLDFKNHKAAAFAKRLLETGQIKLWGWQILVEWARPRPLEESDQNIMSQVKILYVANLSEECTCEILRRTFEVFGNVLRVKKVNDYAFIHFDLRENALNAMNNLNNKKLCGSYIYIRLAKPPRNLSNEEIIPEEYQTAHDFETSPPPALPHPDMVYYPLSYVGPILYH